MQAGNLPLARFFDQGLVSQPGAVQPEVKDSACALVRRNSPTRRKPASLLGNQAGVAQTLDRDRDLIIDQLRRGAGIEALGLD